MVEEENYVFRKVLFFIPPTSNMASNSPQMKRLKKKVKPWLEGIEKTIEFPQGQWLYGRVIYFNHERNNSRDIHNIIKPLFDLIGDLKIYEDDKLIRHFEGYRLDMQHNDDYFEIELNITQEPELERALTETACLVEVGVLPLQPSSLVRITWLQ